NAGQAGGSLGPVFGGASLYFVREPDCWGTDYSSPVHRLFQFVTFGEGLCSFNGAELVGHGDVVGIVSGLIDSPGRYALRLLDRDEIVVDLPPSLVVRDCMRRRSLRRSVSGPLCSNLAIALRIRRRWPALDTPISFSNWSSTCRSRSMSRSLVSKASAYWARPIESSQLRTSLMFRVALKALWL